MRDLPENTTAPERDEQLVVDHTTTKDPQQQLDPRVEEALRRQRQAMGFP